MNRGWELFSCIEGFPQGVATGHPLEACIESVMLRDPLQITNHAEPLISTKDPPQRGTATKTREKIHDHGLLIKAIHPCRDGNVKALIAQR